MTTLQWFNGDLVIENPTPCIKKLLQYQHKSLEQIEGTYDRGTVKTIVPLWADIPDRPNTIITYQGLIDLVTAHCKTKKITFVIEDLRLKMPAPRMAGVKGFRHSQFELFVTAIRENRSGIIEAPTRFGKSSLILNFCRAYAGLGIVVTAPGVDLLKQLHRELQAAMPDRDIRGIYTGAHSKGQGVDVTVCSLDSLEKLNPESVRLMLIDEVHAAATPERIPVLSGFKNARFLGFGATPEGRFDGADIVTKGLIGPVIARRTFREAVAEGAICDIHVWMVRVKYAPFWCLNRNKAYQKLVHRNPGFVGIVKALSENIIPADWQTLIFIDNIKQAETLHAALGCGEVAIASKMNAARRDDLFQRMVACEVQRCICTSIYSQGVTFPDVRALINCAGGGGSITGVQKPGRLAQNRPGKKYGHMIDFYFEMDEPKESESEPHEGVPVKPKAQKRQPCKMPMIDSIQRLRVYEKRGYVIHMIDDLNQIKLE